MCISMRKNNIRTLNLVVYVRVRWIMETPKQLSTLYECPSVDRGEAGHCAEAAEERCKLPK